MRDPFPIGPASWLTSITEPLSHTLALPTLPVHIHEIVIAFSLYLWIQLSVSPYLSTRLFPRHYPKLSPRTRLNWDVHVVSFFQSVIICTFALYVMWVDEERRDMNWQGRVWGYTGGTGLIQSFACGYFLWDLWVTGLHLNMFGVGMLLHAVSALVVFCFGFRPFVNYYAPVFILYELSSPFLNIHWFCDKLDLTGSTTQLINGIFLLSTFFSCRLIYGTYSSVCVFLDVYRAMNLSNSPTYSSIKSGGDEPISEIMKYAGERKVPLWLAASYLASNIVLNVLNWYWMGQMIRTVRKRFEPPFGTKVVEKKRAVEFEMTKGVDASGNKTVGIEATELRRRPVMPERGVTDQGFNIP
ncbi:DUF887-domain-containing protein [Tothia fuscella]|uniref:DUF887-domain-containing protein n=1 Tax=Tothia fuscella TaxID=1048955 RepID=A0A9P4U398_9PEZI|nr:DUF887-domain-containing protein [Tothia fuscella]